jgi:hypothetical protein
MRLLPHRATATLLKVPPFGMVTVTLLASAGTPEKVAWSAIV